MTTMRLLDRITDFLAATPPERLLLPDEIPAVARTVPDRRKPPPFGEVDCHEHFEAMLCLGGRPRYSLAGKTGRVEAECVLLIPPGVEHAYVQGGGFHHIWLIAASGTNVTELSCRNGAFIAGDHLRAPQSRPARNALETAFAAIDEKTRRLRLYSAILNIVSHLRQTADRQPTRISTPLSSAFLDQILEYIDENYRNPVNLADLSDMARLSPAYFSTVFKKQVGASFKEYLTGVRVKAAMELLGKTNRSVAEISAAVGYDDPFYFSRAFKKVTGRSPSEWRKVR
jgi:AraC-like DNA-binding protein